MKKITLVELMKQSALTMQGANTNEFSVSLSSPGRDGNKERLIVLPTTADPAGIEVELQPEAGVAVGANPLRLETDESNAANGVTVVDANFKGQVIVRYREPTGLSMQEHKDDKYQLTLLSGEVQGVFVYTGNVVLPGQEVQAPYPASSPTPESAPQVSNDGTLNQDKAHWQNKAAEAANATSAVDEASGGVLRTVDVSNGTGAAVSPEKITGTEGEPAAPVVEVAAAAEPVVDPAPEPTGPTVTVTATNATVSAVSAVDAATINPAEGDTGAAKAEAVAVENEVAVAPAAEPGAAGTDPAVDDPDGDGIPPADVEEAGELPTEEERQEEEELTQESFHFTELLKGLEQYSSLSLQDAEKKPNLVKRVFAALVRALNTAWAAIKRRFSNRKSKETKDAADNISKTEVSELTSALEEMRGTVTYAVSHYNETLVDILKVSAKMTVVVDALQDIIQWGKTEGAKVTGDEPFLDYVNKKIDSIDFSHLPSFYSIGTSGKKVYQDSQDFRAKMSAVDDKFSVNNVKAMRDLIGSGLKELSANLDKFKPFDSKEVTSEFTTGTAEGNREAFNLVMELNASALRMLRSSELIESLFKDFCMSASRVARAQKSVTMEEYTILSGEYDSIMSEVTLLSGDEKEVKEAKPNALKRAFLAAIRWLMRVGQAIAEKCRTALGKIRIRKAKENLEVVKKEVVPLLLEHKSDSAFDHLNPKRTGSEGIKALAASYSELQGLVKAGKDAQYLVTKVCAGLNTSGVGTLHDILDDAKGLVDAADKYEPFAISFTKQADSLSCNEVKSALDNLKTFFTDIGSISEWNVTGLKDIDKMMEKAFEENPALELSETVLENLGHLNKAAGKLNHLVLQVFNCVGHFVAALSPELKMESFNQENDIGESYDGGSRVVIAEEPFEPGTVVLVRNTENGYVRVENDSFRESLNGQGVGDSIVITDSTLTGNVSLFAQPVQAVAAEVTLEDSVGGDNDPVSVVVEEREGVEVRIGTVAVDDAAEDAAIAQYVDFSKEADESREERDGRFLALSTVNSMIVTAERLGYNGDVQAAELVMEGFLDTIKNISAKIGNWFDRTFKYYRAWDESWNKIIKDCNAAVKNARTGTAQADLIDLGRIVRMLTIDGKPVTDYNQLVNELNRYVALGEETKKNLETTSAIFDNVRRILNGADDASEPNGAIIVKQVEKYVKSLGKRPYVGHITVKSFAPLEKYQAEKYAASPAFLGEVRLVEAPNRYDICVNNSNDVIRDYVGTVVVGVETRWDLDAKLNGEAKLLSAKEMEALTKLLNKVIDAWSMVPAIRNCFAEMQKLNRVLRDIEEFDRELINAVALIFSAESRLYDPLNGLIISQSHPLQAIGRMVVACGKLYK